MQLSQTQPCLHVCATVAAPPCQQVFHIAPPNISRNIRITLPESNFRSFCTNKPTRERIAVSFAMCYPGDSDPTSDNQNTVDSLLLHSEVQETSSWRTDDEDKDPTMALSWEASRRHYSCANWFARRPLQSWGAFSSKEPEVEWTTLGCFGITLQHALGTYLSQQELLDCQDAGCLARRAKLNQAAPPCLWTPFRNWIITLLSCDGEFLGDADYRTVSGGTRNISTICLKLLQEVVNKHGKVSLDRICIDLVGVTELLTWLARFDGWRCTGWNYLDGLHIPTSDFERFFHAAATRASDATLDIGICQARLWGISAIAPRGAIDLPSIVQVIEQNQQLRHGKEHRNCTPRFCYVSDVNSTLVRQLHKCTGGSCGEMEFPLALLDNAALNNTPTAWTSQGIKAKNHSLVDSAHDSYMAISHVWSDGTGVGLKKPGVVNECLIDFFMSIAKDLQCGGIWWDAICIPIDRSARRKAMDNMISNYTYASVTLVHDTSLVNFGWKDDGSPCVALVLSDWFTRGWTAAELAASYQVKVLFKDPCNPDGPPLVKDLDDEVMRVAPLTVPTMGFSNAAKIVGKLRKWRGKSFKNKQALIALPVSGFIKELSSLLEILEARVTSWSRDKMLIAGLMSLDSIDSSLDPSDITKKLLEEFSLQVNYGILFHAAVPICKSGPWSWCPPSIFDLAFSQLPPGRSDLDLEDGCLTATLRCGTLARDDRNYIVPYSNHPAMVMKVSDALTRWNSCLLMANDDEAYMDAKPPLFVLATTVGVRRLGENRGLIECRYVGAVLFPVDRFRDKAGTTLNWPWQRHACRFGRDLGLQEKDAKNVLDQFEDGPFTFKVVKRDCVDMLEPPEDWSGKVQAYVLKS